ncbi:MAG: prolipoprotein diacylglyceryl transferase [Acidimicrobiia bacterium]|nr:prolipoprotein diacylglyceryl transferase [Acidimicrobiia bacterium]
MFPVLFTVWDVPVQTHEFFIATGVLVAAVVFVGEARRRGRWSDDLWAIVAGALIGGGLFARFGTGIQYLAEAPDPTVLGLFTQAGRSILGGLVGAYVGARVAKKLIGYRRSTGDLFAPAVAVGMAIGRVGCFLTEQLGTVTSLPWGITVTPGQAARMSFCPDCQLGQPMHPSFLYEIGFHVFAFVALGILRRDPRFDGRLFPIYVGSYGVFRFMLEFVRGNPPLWFGLSGSHIFLMAGFTVAAATGVARLARRRPVPVG